MRIATSQIVIVILIAQITITTFIYYEYVVIPSNRQL